MKKVVFRCNSSCDCNWTRTQNHLVLKRTLNHLAKLFTFRFRACFEQGVPWYWGNYRVWIHSETRTWHDKNIQAIVLVLHICYCFLLEKQICESSKWGRPRDVYGTQLQDVPANRWWDVLGTSPGRRSYMFFKFNSETYLTYFDRLLKTCIVNCRSKKFDLRICGKIPSLMFWH